MQKYLLLIVIIIIGYLAYNYFYHKSNLVLKASNFSGVDEIDTLEAYPDKGLYILGLVRHKALGHFSYDLGITKQDISNPKHSVKYEIENTNKAFRLSKDYIAFIKSFGVTNYGWFYIKAGKIMPILPSIEKFEDSIKTNVFKDVFIKDKNGYINLYVKGKIIKTYNYGNLILKDSITNFDSLEYKLYKITNNKLVTISSDVDDLFQQKEGTFFIPLPGHGVINKYNKGEILDYIDSVFTLGHLPKKITFKSN